MVHIILLVAVLFTLPNLNKKYPFYILTFSILFLFLALRYDYGNDYKAYLEIHNGFKEGLSVWGENDILFKQLNLLTPNFYLFVAIISLFYIITIFYLIKSNITVKKYWFSVLLLLINPYLFLVHLSSIRQTIAICIFIFAVKFIIDKKIFMYILFVFIAVGFHKSAIILLPLYFLINDRKLGKKLIVCIYGFIVLLISTPLLDNILNKILEYLPQYRCYYEQGQQNSLRATLISSIFFFFIIANINKLKGKEMIYAKLSLIGTIISILSIKVSMLVRVQMYFEIFLIISIPQIFSKINIKINKQILFILIILIYLLRYYSFFSNPLYDSYRIYKTILNN